MRLDPMPRFAKNLDCPICHQRATNIGWQADDDLYRATTYSLVINCKCCAVSKIKLY